MTPPLPAVRLVGQPLPWSMDSEIGSDPRQSNHAWWRKYDTAVQACAPTRRNALIRDARVGSIRARCVLAFDYIRPFIPATIESCTMTKKYERRTNRDLSERIEIAIKTRRAFDDLHARRYLELSGVSPALAEQVLGRSAEKLRADIAASTSSQRELPWFPHTKKL
jgi:hypothetical protein